MSRLDALCEQSVFTTEALGIHPQAIESMAFAWMAYMRVSNKKIPIAQNGRKALLGSVLRIK
jgi:1,6-anhydro-N-acetylmuramate kinase